MSATFSAQAQLGWRAGQLSARPGPPTGQPLPAGLHRLDSAGDAESALFVPPPATGGRLPLVVLLHGATGHPERALPVLRADAERGGFLLLAPKSRGYTWDIIGGSFGPDLAVLDRLLVEVFDRFEVDPARIALAGFSDGASYALTIGLINGELFSRILAFSPGFTVPGRRAGKPAVFVSHGKADTVLPIDRCSRRIVPLLRADGYQVDYREFAGGHTVPADLATAAVEPLAQRSPG
ncbi:MAG TPA: PHB depolymerase family esterase [Jatrophihabitans sp.]|jgi:predicted esterase|uniref:alpha/beta hydrolase n=1 Tax=Jatrophihabitans sp. TaxID=1932789 RepID=UPI002EF61AEE